jgi:hypothetical protein
LPNGAQRYFGGVDLPGPLCGMPLLLVFLFLRGGHDLSNVGSKLIDNLEGGAAARSPLFDR